MNTDLFWVRQIQVVHKIDKILFRFSQSRIKCFFFPDCRVRDALVVVGWVEDEMVR